MRLRLNKRLLQGATFPIGLFAFAAVGIAYAGIIFTPTTRWVFLALLGLVLIKSGRVSGALNARFGLPALLYCSWCLLTSFWSIVPELSVLKGFASISTILIFTAAGRYWATGWTSNPPLSYLVPIAVAALASAFTGATQNPGEGIQLYQGLTGNPNYLGIIVAASSPLAIFFLHQSFGYRSTSFVRALAVIGTVVLASLLWRAGSRSAIMCTLSVVAFAIVAMRPSKMMMVIILVTSAVAITAVAAPEFEDQLYTRFVMKYSPDGDILYTRREAWVESMEGARQGGWLGLGYGAAYGDTSFSAGLTSVGYGREKGNSQLAVLEEVGAIGAMFYVFLILSIISELIGGLRRAPNRDIRMEIALVTGLMFGLLLQSVFEGWWTSSGSVEAAIFWATVGVGSGLVRRGAQARSEYAIRQRGHGPPHGPAPSKTEGLA